jgi:hypothetical protein
MKLICIIIAAGAIAGSASAADPVLSPRAAEYRETFTVTPGFVERKGFYHPGGKGALAPARKVTGKTEERDLVREARRQVYTGKTAGHPRVPQMELAPVGPK